MRTSLTNPQEQNYVTQLRVFAAVYNNATWRVAAAAEIAKPAKYGSLYRHIYIIYLYIIRCGHQSTSVVVRIVFFFVFTVVQTRIPRAFGYFFVTCTRSRYIYILILGCTGDGCFLTLPACRRRATRDLFGRGLKRTRQCFVLTRTRIFFCRPTQIRSGAINANYNICAPDDYLFFYFFSIRKTRSKSFVRRYVNVLNIKYILYYIYTCRYLPYICVERKTFA